MSDKRMAMIYALQDPRTGIIRYVGKTVQPRKRFLEHIRVARKKVASTGPACHRDRWIGQLLNEGLEPAMVIIEEVPYAEWARAEQGQIAAHRAAGVPLTNCTDGGEGCVNPTPEARARLSAAKKGCVFTEEHRARISAANKGHKRCLGKKASPEARAHMSAANKGNTNCLGRNVSQETRAKMSVASKAVWAGKKQEAQS